MAVLSYFQNIPLICLPKEEGEKNKMPLSPILD